LALFANGKRVAGLMGGDGRLHFWQVANLPSVERPPSRVFSAAPGRGSFLAAAWLRHFSNKPAEQRFYVLDQAQRLHCWQSQPAPEGKAARYALQASNVLALMQLDDHRLIYLSHADGRLSMHSTGMLESFGYDMAIGQTAVVDGGVLVAGTSHWRNGLGSCAVRCGAGEQEQWRIFHGNGLKSSLPDIRDVQLPPGWRAIALVDAPADAAPMLVLMSPRRNALALFDGQRTEALYMSPSTIVRHSVCAQHGLLALVTEQRELIVLSPAERAVRLQVRSHGGDDASA
jgi:hypothetical protein